jgi:hypothetical protein
MSSEGHRAYVWVNNRAEGNGPLTVEGLVGMLQGVTRSTAQTRGVPRFTHNRLMISCGSTLHAKANACSDLGKANASSDDLPQVS